MISSTRRCLWLLLLLSTGWTAGLTSVSQGQEDGRPTYARRLQLPIVSDDLQLPRSVHADLHTGEVFICDVKANRIAIFDPDGLYRYQIRGGSAFSTPLDIAVDPDGFLYVVAFRDGVLGVQRLDFDGQFIETIRLSGGPDGLSEPVPSSLALSISGERLFVLDSQNNRLWIARSDGEVLTAVDLAEGLSSDEEIEQILGHVDVYGDRVLVAFTTFGVVRLYDLEGRLQEEVGFKGTSQCKTASPVASAIDSTGRIIVLDRQRAMFMRWDPESNTCLSEHSRFGNAPGEFYQPADLTLDGSGRIYVTQGFESKVQVFEGALPALGSSDRSDVDEEPGG